MSEENVEIVRRDIPAPCQADWAAALSFYDDPEIELDMANPEPVAGARR